MLLSVNIRSLQALLQLKEHQKAPILCADSIGSACFREFVGVSFNNGQHQPIAETGDNGTWENHPS